MFPCNGNHLPHCKLKVKGLRAARRYEHCVEGAWPLKDVRRLELAQRKSPIRFDI
jgi:hypothetical protein